MKKRVHRIVTEMIVFLCVVCMAVQPLVVFANQNTSENSEYSGDWNDVTISEEADAISDKTDEPLPEENNGIADNSINEVLGEQNVDLEIQVAPEETLSSHSVASEASLDRVGSKTVPAITKTVSRVEITKDLQDVSCCVGETAVFSVEATGDGLSYVWQFSDNEGKSWSNSSIKKNTLTVTGTLARNNRLYRVTVTDSSGYSVVSREARLTVSEPGPVLVTDLQDVNCYEGETAVFSVEATGNGLSYVWQFSDNEGKSWSNSSIKKNTLTVMGTLARSNRLYRVTVTDSNGYSVVSREARLTVSEPGPVLVTDLQDVNCYEGETAVFSVEATGNGLSYVWQFSDNEGKSWSNNSSKKNTLTVTGTMARSNRLYRVTVTDSSGYSVVSREARLTVSEPGPVLVTDLQDVNCYEGETAVFSVEATGNGLSYVWQFSDNEGKSWSNNSSKVNTLKVTGTLARNNRLYRVTVTDSSGYSVVSREARLTVSEPGPVLVTDLQDVNCYEGETAVFSVEATGDGLSYAWQFSDNEGKSWSNNSSKVNTLKVTGTLARSNRLYRVTVTDSSGYSVVSREARLTVSEPGPVLVTDLQDVNCYEGETAVFSVEATGDGLSYAWQFSDNEGKSWSNNSSKVNTLKVTGTLARSNRLYRVTVTDSSGYSVVSREARLTVKNYVEPPVIVSQPQDWTCGVGAKAYFSVFATGNGLTYQWQYSKNEGQTWSNSSVQTPAYSAAVTAAYDGRLYRCLITNEEGRTVASEAVHLCVSSNFEIIRQPESFAGQMNEEHYFEIQVGGENVTYVWQESYYPDTGWTDITSTATATTARLRQTIYPSATGKYIRCMVTNGDGLVLYSSVSRMTAADSGLVQYGNYTYYIDNEGCMAKNLQMIQGSLYFFGDNGAMRTGFRKIDGKSYCFGEDGKAVKGFYYNNDNHGTYYFDDSFQAVTGWNKIEGKQYYFYESGVMARGTTKINGGHYYFDFETGTAKKRLVKVGMTALMYFDETGASVAGLQTVDGALYYFSEGTSSYGVSAFGLQSLEGNTYYFDPVSHKAQTGFITVNGNVYYFGEDYKMVTGLQWINGKLFYFKTDGVQGTGIRKVDGNQYCFMDTDGAAIIGWNTSEEGCTYYYGADGAAVSGRQSIDGTDYYFNSSCELTTGLVKLDDGSCYLFCGENELVRSSFYQLNDRSYYIDESGYAVTGLQLIDGKYYYFNENGIMQTGSQTVNGSSCYFDIETGELVSGFVTRENGKIYCYNGIGVGTGLVDVDGKKYYLNENGVVQHGRQKVGDAYYYFDIADGHALTGWINIATTSGDAYRVYAGEDYKLVTGIQVIDGNTYAFDASGWQITGKSTIDGVIYYFTGDMGAAYTGWYKSSSGYYFYYDGANGMVTGPGIRQIDGRYYYIGSDNTRSTGLKIIDGVRYYFDPECCELVTGFVTLEDSSSGNGVKRYYYDGLNGALKGLQKIDGNVYYFDTDYGIMQYGYKIIDGTRYYFDPETGIRVDGLITVSDGAKYMIDAGSDTGVQTGAVDYGGVRYYVYNSGKVQSGHVSASANPWGFRAYFDETTGEQQLGMIDYTSTSGTVYPYYFTPDSCLTSGTAAIQNALNEAKAAGGWHTVEGVTYYAQDGSFLTGIQNVDGENYYFSILTGAMLTGLRTVNGSVYYFDPSTGAMQTGWVTVNNKNCYFDTDTGCMRLGMNSLDEGTMYLLPGGGVATGTAMIGQDQYSFSETGSGTIVVIEKQEAPEPASNCLIWSEDGQKYYDAYGFAVTGFQVIDHKTYYFNNDGLLCTGFITSGGKTYYATENGLLYGLQTIEGNVYYFSPTDGSMRTGIVEINGVKRYFDKDGINRSGWVTLATGRMGYVDPEAGLLTGIQEIEGTVYGFTAAGYLRNGFASVADSSGVSNVMYFDKSGMLVYGLNEIGGSLYYFNMETGVQETGWITVDGYEYYFSPDTGRAWKGFQKIDNMYCYFDNNTAQRQYGFITISEKLYYFTGDGEGRAVGWTTIDNELYFFDSVGRAVNGYMPMEGVKYFFENGKCVDGIHWIDSERAFAFASGGGFKTGLIEENGKKYYFYPDSGFMAVGLISIDDTLYYVDPEHGILQNTQVEVAGITYALGADGAAVAVGNSKLVTLINAGIEKLGLPYGSEEGGDDNEPGAYSCSTFTTKVLNEVGIDVTATAYFQYYSLTHDGYEIEIIDNYADAKPGDLIYTCIVDCKFGDACTFWNEIHHVSIYLGDGKVMESTEGTRSGVLVQDWSEKATCYNYAIIRLKELN